MSKTITFYEMNAFYEELDSIIATREPIQIIFTSTPPNPYSDLWKRLGQCKGWSQLISVDYRQSQPEFTPPFEEIQAGAELWPLISSFFKFGYYRKYRLTTQEYSVGRSRTISLQPK